MWSPNSGLIFEGFTIDLVCKDLQLALDLGAQTGVPLEASALVEQLHRRALTEFDTESGEMSVVKLYEKSADTAFRV